MFYRGLFFLAPRLLRVVTMLLLQKPLRSQDAISQARLECRILPALLHVAGDRSSDDLRYGAVLNGSHCFQLFRLLFGQANSHRFGTLHEKYSCWRYPGCQEYWYHGIMQP